jgi:hypothetical protein
MDSTYGNPAADTAIALLFADEPRMVVEPGGRYAPDTVTVYEGCTGYQFQRGTDRVWRLATVSTYGNVRFVSGEGCDASGWVVPDAEVNHELSVLANTY